MKIAEALTLLLLLLHSTTEEEDGEEEEKEEKGDSQPQLPPGYCALDKPEYTAKVRWIRRGFQKRLYTELPSGNLSPGSEICGCQEGGELKCTMLEEVPSQPCNTEQSYYSHKAPFYLAFRGACLCFAGDFICAKQDFSKGTKPGEVPVPPEPLVGVYLYLGFSRKDGLLVRSARESIAKEAILGEEEAEVTATVQQEVSHITSNINKSECTIGLVEKSSENYILSATLDQFLESRMKKQMTDEMLWTEKEECSEAVASIAARINKEDADMRSHVVMSIFMVASAEANVPPEPQISASPTIRRPPLLPTTLLIISTFGLRLHSMCADCKQRLSICFF